MEQTSGDYQRIFQIEIDGFCHGIRNYPGEIYDELVHIIIEDLADSVLLAIKDGYSFNLLTVAEKICEATKFRISAEGTVAKLLSILPHPGKLSEDEQFVLAQIIDGVDRIIPGTLDRLQWEWRQAA